MRSVLRLYLMTIKNPQNVAQICFVPVLMTVIYDLKIDLIMLNLIMQSCFYLKISSLV